MENFHCQTFDFITAAFDENVTLVVKLYLDYYMYLGLRGHTLGYRLG